ncbi:MAG TPA: hypothetical protein VHV82_18870 [Sporichthyaceae bacterium]|nr:hypothetical protein [Sporichthyaceae bacterium]
MTPPQIPDSAAVLPAHRPVEGGGSRCRDDAGGHERPGQVTVLCLALDAAGKPSIRRGVRAVVRDCVDRGAVGMCVVFGGLLVFLLGVAVGTVNP